MNIFGYLYIMNGINMFFILGYLIYLVIMSVTTEKLEEIYKVYDEKRNNRIPTAEIGIFLYYSAKLIRSARLFPSEQDI